MQALLCWVIISYYGMLLGPYSGMIGWYRGIFCQNIQGLIYSLKGRDKKSEIQRILETDLRLFTLQT